MLQVTVAARPHVISHSFILNFSSVLVQDAPFPATFKDITPD